MYKVRNNDQKWVSTYIYKCRLVYRIVNTQLNDNININI